MPPQPFCEFLGLIHITQELCYPSYIHREEISKHLLRDKLPFSLILNHHTPHRTGVSLVPLVSCQPLSTSGPLVSARHTPSVCLDLLRWHQQGRKQCHSSIQCEQPVTVHFLPSSGDPVDILRHFPVESRSTHRFLPRLLILESGNVSQSGCVVFVFLSFSHGLCLFQLAVINSVTKRTSRREDLSFTSTSQSIIEGNHQSRS